MRRALVIRPQKIGDIVATLPTVDALLRRAPQLEIDVLAGLRSAALLQDDPRFATVFTFSRGSDGLAVVSEARRRQYDLVLDLVDGDSITALLVSQRCSRPHTLRLGCRKVRHAPFYDGNARGHDTRHHAIERTADTLELLGIDPVTVLASSPPHVPARVSQEVEGFLASSRPDTPRLGVNLSAGSPTRRWPTEQFAELLHRLARERPNLAVTILTDPRERTRGEQLLETLSGDTSRRVRLTPDGWSIQHAAGLIAHLDLLVTPDTSLLHIARSFGVKVVGLYPNSPWNLERWSPYGQADGIVASSSATDLLDLGVDPVLDAVRAHLA